MLGAYATALVTLQPGFDNFVTTGQIRNKDYGDAFKALIVLVGTALWRYGQDDGVFTPKFLLGRDKEDAQVNLELKK